MGCAQSKRSGRASVEGSPDFQLESIGSGNQGAAPSSKKAKQKAKLKEQQQQQDQDAQRAEGHDSPVSPAGSSGDGAGTMGQHAGEDPSAANSKPSRRSASQDADHSGGARLSRQSSSGTKSGAKASSNSSSGGGGGDGGDGSGGSGNNSSNNNSGGGAAAGGNSRHRPTSTAGQAAKSSSSGQDATAVAAAGAEAKGEGGEAANRMARKSSPAGAAPGDNAKGANISRRASAEAGNAGNLRAHPSSSSSSANTSTAAADSDEFYGLDINYNDIELRESIGSGTYGQVFKCRYKGKQLALKKIFVPEGAMERAEMLEDFAKELGILSVLRHERIVQFKGAVRKHPTYALMFELCEGCVGTLLRMVRRRKVSVTWSICITIAKDCAEAVSYLHSLRPRILHRDLKSENLLLTSRFRCKLTDFGLSRVYEGRRRTMTVCGTPCWVAPEIFRGEAYNEKIDVYSFGVVLWELFTGRKPYTEYESVELPYRVGKKGLRPPLLKHVPPSINRLMRDCWHESPGMRPTFPEIEKRIGMIESELNDAGCLNTPAHQTKVSWNQQVAHARQSSEAAAVPGATRRSHTSTVA